MQPSLIFLSARELPVPGQRFEAGDCSLAYEHAEFLVAAGLHGIPADATLQRSPLFPSLGLSHDSLHRMFECMYVCMHACMHACMYVCMYVGMYVCKYVHMHVCMYVCMHPYIYGYMDGQIGTDRHIHDELDSQMDMFFILAVAVSPRTDTRRLGEHFLARFDG